jgi:hypothetical protein
MKFAETVDNVNPIAALKRIASAHVVDHRNLKDEELRAAIKKIEPQYIHEDTVKKAIESVYIDDSIDIRVLARIILEDVLLEEIGFGLPSDSLEEKIIGIEQAILDKSNETDLSDLAGGKSTALFEKMELYYFVLGVAWEHRNTKSPDEANLLRKLRRRLGITHAQHRIMEAKLGKYPKVNNEIHSRSEMRDARNFLQKSGLLFQIKNDRGVLFDIIPEELAAVMRKIFQKTMRIDGYRIMLGHRLFRKKDTLKAVLKTAKADVKPTERTAELIEKILVQVDPHDCLYTFGNDELHDWCSEMGLPVSGSKEHRIERLLTYYDSMQIRNASEEEDERKIWYDVFEALAYRDRQLLRAEGVIDKDLEIESKFEKATEYLFEKRLNHKPLNQPGTNKPDGLLSFKDMYIMWDNKSKEAPGEVDLNSHLNQFHGYMQASNKHVPIFLVIAPDFSPNSEAVAVRYAAENIGRNIVLIKASDLKALAEEWASDGNKKKDEPFPLGLLARSGRFTREVIGCIF